MMASDERKRKLRASWLRILGTLAKAFASKTMGDTLLTAAATSFAFGTDKKCKPANERDLFHNFVAYLKLILDSIAFEQYISPDTDEKCKDGQGDIFGKPIWDFEYPESSFFVTRGNMVGCCIAPTQSGDMVFVPLRSVYPLVLRPEGDQFRIRGFCFVHGAIHGEKQSSLKITIKIC